MVLLHRFARLGLPFGPAVTIAAACATLLTGALLLTGLATPLEKRLSDLWFDTSALEPSGRIVIVDTAPAAVALGDGLRLPRARIATLLERIEAAGSERILIGLGLTGDTTAADDGRLEAALAAARPGSLAITSDAVATSDRSGATHWQRTKVLERFARHTSVVASDLAFDADGRLRRFGLGPSSLPPMTSSAAWLADRASDGSQRIDFGIDVTHVPVIDAMDLLQGRPVPALAGHRVIVASYAAALGHKIRVPRFDALTRPDITALSAETLLRKEPLHPLNEGVASVFSLLLAAAATFWIARIGRWLGLVAVVGACLCIVGIAAAQQTGSALILPTAAPMLAVLSAYAAAQVACNKDFRRLREALAGFFGRVDLRLAFVMHETGEALVTFTPEGQILSMNVAAQTLFAQAADVKGTSITDLLGVQADDLLSATRSSRPGQIEATIDPDDRGTRHLDLTVNTMRAEAGGWIGIASIRDVTEQRENIERLRKMTLEDPLTGLVNRLGFERALAAACAAEAETGEQTAVLLCDLDGFKGVNDTHGHPAGDALLNTIAARLRAGAPQSATVARLGGDEFGLLLRAPQMGDAEAHAVAERLVALIAEPVQIGDHQVRVGISIGIALQAGRGLGPERLIQIADDAMYRAKRARAGVAVGRSKAA